MSSDARWPYTTHWPLQVHTVAELERVLQLSPEMLDPATTLLGINNRDLQTFEVSLENTALIMGSSAGQEVCSCSSISFASGIAVQSERSADQMSGKNCVKVGTPSFVIISKRSSAIVNHP